MANLKELKTQLAAAMEIYNDAEGTATVAQDRANSIVVRDLKRAISAALLEGANPCPRCLVEDVDGTTTPGSRLIAIEQPTSDGGTTYEIGCSICLPFVHDDGTVRECRVKGGMMPSHAVDAWNGGPDFWKKAKNQSEAMKPPPRKRLS